MSNYVEEELRERYKSSVLSILDKKYNIKGNIATHLVNDSFFKELLETDPCFVMAYPSEYWADEINEVASYLEDGNN